MNENLLKQTLALLQNRSAKIMLKQIAADTGLSYPWICAFHSERITEYNHPKVEAKIKTLHAYLIKLPSVS